MTTSRSEPLRCAYCGAEWGLRFDHKPDCYILTGILPPVLGRKKRPMTKPEPVKPLGAGDE